MLGVLLIHQAHGGVGYGKEAVILRVHAETVAGKRVYKKLQLVVTLPGDMDAEATEHVFKVIGRLLEVNTFPASHHNIEMGIDKLLVFASNDFLNLFNILHGNLVARIGYGGMAVALLVKDGKLSFLPGHEYHLIIDDGLNLRYRIKHRHQVNRQ